MLTCSTCGATNERGSVFCSQCATNLTVASQGVRYNPNAQLPPPQHGYQYGNSYSLPSRSGTILTLGILSLVVCGIMGPIAWAMGNEELRRIDSGTTEPGQRGSVVAGRICGIIATCLMIFSALLIVFVFATVSSHSHRY
ncbi:MAG: hypothetical protein H6Q90_3859 [Deltaproteobacteria bacterium]|nr:hypothetical protein [Deltaproteobacteria bacterium]